MELTYAAPATRTDARAQFEARAKMALALTLDLERKLVQWGTALERKNIMQAAA